jgi:hypothetical protein
VNAIVLFDRSAVAPRRRIACLVAVRGLKLQYVFSAKGAKLIQPGATPGQRPRKLAVYNLARRGLNDHLALKPHAKGAKDAKKESSL